MFGALNPVTLTVLVQLSGSIPDLVKFYIFLIFVIWCFWWEIDLTNLAPTFCFLVKRNLKVKR